jgi:hypothetical protein
MALGVALGFLAPGFTTTLNDLSVGTTSIPWSSLSQQAGPYLIFGAKLDHRTVLDVRPGHCISPR